MTTAPDLTQLEAGRGTSAVAPPLSNGDDDGRPHLVQFYESEDALRLVVVQFVAAGLAAGEPTVVIATEPHRREISVGLAETGIDVERSCSAGRLVLLDAETTLSRFMVGSSPDPGLFRGTVGAVFDKAAAGAPGSGQLRAYGEMVDVLWRRGDRGAAVMLEELWNDLQRTRAFSLLCAYVMSNFYNQTDGLRRVCHAHTQVWTPRMPRAPRAPDGPRLSIDGPPSPPLAEPVRALAAEIAHRQEIERALRRSLRDLRLKEEASAAHLRRTERLNKITAAIADAVTAQQVVEAVVDQVGAALDASTAALWLVDDHDAAGAGDVARLSRALGYGDVTRRRLDALPLEGAPALPVVDTLRSGQPVWIESQDDLLARYPDLVGVATPGRKYSVACLPISARGRTVGALGFTFDDARRLCDDERSFLLLVGRYSGQALERLRLLEVEQESRLRAELLYGLAAAVIRADGQEGIHQAALDAIERALGTNRASILVFDADGVMRFRAWRNLSDDYRRAVEGHSPWSRDTRDPEPIISTDVEADPAMARYLPIFRREGIGALGFIPLVAGGRLIGKFMVYYPGPRALDAQELELARAIANHVAAAVSRFNSMAELQETVRFNEMFTGILGHDLRNPLGAMITAARLAMARDEGDKLRKPLSRILTSGERMTRMIDQLLDFTRVRLGPGIPLALGELDLVSVVGQVVDELDDANPEWTFRLTHAGDTVGVWDADRLSQVFSNLVANAVQHGVAAGGVTVVVDGTAREAVRVEVHNQGSVQADLLARIFEPLSGRVRRLEKARGLGLGLYITSEIVRSHGGEIAVRSDEPRGTTFMVILPRRAPGGAGP